jgi:uncharacterized protein with GYD domain
MTTYVSLINWTDEGIKNFRDTTQRAQDFSRVSHLHPEHQRLVAHTMIR